MFKKLDKLIIRAFIGPFIATFFITLLVLVMQFFWLYIDEFVGKGIGIPIILEFIWYQSAALVPLALPLAILLSSLMTFGNLGESFELVAVKSAGISLLRFMRPVFIITIFVSGIAFLFSNNIIPVANLKSRTLLGDIVSAKPAFDLKEGIFYDRIHGFSIKIGKKEANDTIIRDVIIYEQNNPLQDNFIIAKRGVMRVSADKRYLEFNLQDGWRYQEKGDNLGGPRTDFIRMGFKEYRKQFDLSSFGLVNRTPDSLNRNSSKVMSMRQLDMTIDSLKKEDERIRKQQEESIFYSFPFTRYKDSTWSAWIAPDSGTILIAKSLGDLLQEPAKSISAQKVNDQASTARMSLESVMGTMKERGNNLRRHQIEWHRKISLSAACLVLFLIGAPLGSIIRKGGLGTPMIFAIGFFMLFYFSSTSGEKLAKRDSLTPFSGMWLSFFALVPIGVFLTYKAMHDSRLFNKEFYSRIARNLRSIFKKRG